MGYPRVSPLVRLALLLATGVLVVPALYGQTFTLVTEGEIATDADNAIGAAWVDIDGDADLDLFVGNLSLAGSNSLYRNEGGGSFTKITGSIILDDAQAAFGTCWADYDNDGDLDVANAGAPNSFLYQNDGLGGFTKITDGDIGGATVNRGWSCAWGDYDNDGYVDLFIAHPAGFVGAPVPNSLFKNNGDPGPGPGQAPTFTRVTDSPIVMGLAPYTVGNWTDYDDDGDLDLFIGSGPADGTQDADFLYRNELMETGTATFVRITDLPLNEPRDGQTWNFVDYDNDGDLDGFVTNYWGGVDNGLPNNLYRNDGGAYVEVTTGPLVTDERFSLANVWGDYDNDGDLDVVVTSEAGQDNVYYRNDGPPHYTFTRTTAFDGTPTGNYGATAGDIDFDGDLDLFIPSHSGGQRLFYETQAPAANHWVNLQLVGRHANRAGVGAKVRAEAVVGGKVTRQRREVSTQNTFNGHSSLNVHFGLGDADVVKKLIITWPSGKVDVARRVKANTFYAAVEGKGLVPMTEYLVDQLEDRVHALVAAGALKIWEGAVLKATLKLAALMIRAGREHFAVNVLGAFLHQVDALGQAGKLTEEQGRSLADPAKTAVTLLGGESAALAKHGTLDPTALLEEAAEIPTAISLGPNYPNPFNPATTITYTLPESRHVTLTVYDVQGRVIATLVDGVKEAGQHEARWDATDLASGVYLYRLEAGDFTQARLMHLVK